MAKSNPFFEKESQFQGRYKTSVRHTLWNAYRPFKKQIIFYTVLGFVGRILLLGNANIVGEWVDKLAHPDQINSIFQNFTNKDFLILLSAMSVIGFLLTITYRVLFSRASAQAVSQIYDETTMRVSRMPMSFFDATPAGRIITRFSGDYGNLFRIFGGPLAEFCSIIFDLICMIILITISSPFYLICILFIAIANYMVYVWNRSQLRENRRMLSASRSPAIAHFAETAFGASTIRTFVKQNIFSDRFQKLDSEYLAQKLITLRKTMVFSYEMNFLTGLLLLLTGLLAIVLLKNNLVTVGSIGVAFTFITLSGSTVQNFFEWMSQFEDALVGLERLDDYIQRPIEPGARLPTSARFKTNHWTRNVPLLPEFHPKASSLEFKSVWFRYRENLPYVLKDLNFSVKPGERLGIVGRTGSGKSSLIQILFYLYPIEKGGIYIDGAEPQKTPNDTGIDLESYRKKIAFISQDPTVFEGTLRENLSDVQITDDRLCEALKEVGLDEWANIKGLEMHIEERGRNLSLGERQLICMARCLLQESPIVVMDEATSAVDPRSEEIMIKATEEFFEGKTQLIIAHRLSTLRRCDRILWLDNGEVRMLDAGKKVLKEFKSTELQTV